MRIHPRPQDRRPEPEALQTDDRRVVLAGTLVWVAALVGCLTYRDRLVAAGNEWWVWVCVAGIALGAVGLAHLHRQELRRRG